MTITSIPLLVASIDLSEVGLAVLSIASMLLAVFTTHKAILLIVRAIRNGDSNSGLNLNSSDPTGKTYEEWHAENYKQ